MNQPSPGGRSGLWLKLVLVVLLPVVIVVGISLIAGPSGLSGAQQDQDNNSAPSNPIITQPAPTQTTDQPSPTRSGINNMVATINVPGNLQGGVQYSIPQTGTYRFTYLGGSYSILAEGQSLPNVNPWQTDVLVFMNGSRMFEGGKLSRDSAVLFVTDNGGKATKAQAEAAAKGQGSNTFNFKAGDAITLVASDAQSQYADNPGSVDVGVNLVT